MRFLITGANGQLGHDLVLELQKRGYRDIIETDKGNMDITNREMVQSVFKSYQPDIVFHLAAWTNVDLAETDQELCYQVNVIGTKNIVEFCREYDCKLIYISTDYVFDGMKDGVYETFDKPHPINYYGMTKYMGEREVESYSKHFIVRISWVFGINGKNFVKTMLDLSQKKKEINVIDDQVGSPTYTVDLSLALVDIALSDKYGIYHATNEGYCSWYELAKYVFESNNIDIVVNPIKSSDYKVTATRPMNSRLSKKSLSENGFGLLPSWQDAIKRFNIELQKEKEK